MATQSDDEHPPGRVGTRLIRIDRRTSQVPEIVPATDSTAAETARRGVLVIDPDPRTRARVEEILTAEGYRTASAGDVDTAANLQHERRPDLVLVDIAMGVMEAVPRWERRKTDPAPAAPPEPVTDGYAVLRPLNLDPAAAACPAVCLRGRVPKGARPDRFGVVAYVAKPVQRDALLAGVDGAFLALERGEVERPGSAGPRPALPGAPGFEALPKGLRTVLVVDADAASRRQLRGLLAPYGFTVYESDDGEKALSEALARRPWLIVAEINLPTIDGFELCRRVRSHSLTRHTPLIFLSSWDDYGERFLGLKLGADDYLPKGIPLREILIRVQLVLKRYLDVGTRSRKGTGLEGHVELIGVTGLLQMCHLGRFSGVCTVRHQTRLAVVAFAEGEIVSAQSGRAKEAEAIFDLLAWTEGHFEFVPGEGGGTPLPESFDYLLLEGCRRLDEAGRAADEPAQA